MGSRKRGREEMESSAEPALEQPMLKKLRNTWEFSNLMQYIYTFGKAVKIDQDLDIEDLEKECLKPGPSQVLSDIGLALLKMVSSHRGLTPEIFDEYTRRQYVAKAPARNPFGEEEEPKRFADFDVFTKLKVLVQLSQWTFVKPDRMRERMEERGEAEYMAWRIEEIGYDKQERLYFVLDDNRMYRRTDPEIPPSPPPKSKAKSKKGKAGARASKRRKTKDVEESANDGDVETAAENEEEKVEKDDGFGGRKWECLAVTLPEYQDFLESIKKSRDQDEKALHKRITEQVLPIIESAEASRLRKKQKQERELMNMQKLATAKRSSRLEAKQEKERQDQDALEAERKQKADLAAAKADQEKQKSMDAARESRMMTREQRLKDREYKRILHEEELKSLSEENKKLDAGEARMSERHLKAEMERQKKELAALAEYDDWEFDCSKCGVHGTNLDDGAHSVACEKCDVWQHSACLGISQADAEKVDFHFVCHDCKRREEDSKKPKIPSLKFRVGSSSSPPQQPMVIIPAANQSKKRKPNDDAATSPSKKAKPSQPRQPGSAASPPPVPHPGQNGMHASVLNGPTLSPQGQISPKYPPTLFAGNQMYNESPGLSSPPKAPGYTNSYRAHGGPRVENPHGPRPPPSQSPYKTNGTYNGHYPQQGGYAARQGGYPPYAGTYHPQQGNQFNQHPGWSARYVPPQQTPPQPAAPYGPPPPDQNPFANSFDRQAALPACLSSSTHSPTKHRPSDSPAHSHPSTLTPNHTQTLQTNGHDAAPPIPPVGPPSQSPTKHTSPSTHAMQAPSSSPVAHQPPLHPNGPTSSGFSPMKHSPPHTSAPGHKIPDAPAVLPPSPTQPNLSAPVKSMTPEHAKPPGQEHHSRPITGENAQAGQQ